MTPNHHYTPRTFTLPPIEGISEKQIAEHLTLYHGYVNRTNALYDAFERLRGEDPVLLQELRRRLAFEFNGMRLHELYFGDLEEGPRSLPDGALHAALRDQFGSHDAFLDALRSTVARGSGWVVAAYDAVGQRFHLVWVDEHHLGHLATLPIIVAIDMWEHAYLVDYLPGQKMDYVNAYLAALNWERVAERFERASDA